MTPPRWVADAALSGVAFGVSLVFSYGPGTLRMSLVAALVISAFAAGAVWLSGHRPVASLVVVLALVAGLPLVRSTFEVMDLVVVLVVFRVITGSAVPLAAVAGVCFVALTANDAWLRVAFDRSLMEPSVLYPFLLTALTVGIGAQARRIRRQQAELVALRDRDRQRAVAEERRRIARDLHDVAASHLSALVVRNKLARRLGTSEALAEAADFTARTTGDALASMRQVVHVLGARSDDPLSPPPDRSELDRVVARMEAAGLVVHRDQAQLDRLPDAVAMAVVRIAQEALANVLRHRGPGVCWLSVRHRDGEVVLTVEDDGPAAPPSAEEDRPAYGIVGMRERAESCGGRLEVGPSARGGWAVTAVLPVELARAEP